MYTEIYSIFEYFYRDAGNYKAWGSLLLSEQLSPEQINQMLKHFDSSEFFIAEQVGIPTLYGELWQYSHGPTDDDHKWHSFHAIKLATAEEVQTGSVWGSVDTLLSNTLSVKHWTIRPQYY